VTSSATKAANLALLFGQSGAEEFLARHWPDHPYLAHGPIERLNGIFPSGVDELLQVPCSGMMAFSSSKDGSTENLVVNHDQALPLYRSGLTLYCHDMRSPDFGALASAINEQLGLCGGRTRISAFASSRGMGVATHYDVNDNIVVQVRGTKRWRLATEPSALNPTVGYRVDRPAGVVQSLEAGGQLPARLPDNHTVFDLRPGSAAFVPRGFLHRCETVDEESLHFNVQTAMLTMGDLIAYAFLRKLKPSAPELRARLTHAFERGALKPDFRERLLAEYRCLGDRLSPAALDIDEESIRGFLQFADPRSMFGND